MQAESRSVEAQMTTLLDSGVRSTEMSEETKNLRWQVLQFRARVLKLEEGRKMLEQRIAVLEEARGL
jgi:hypothetical protein